MSKFSNSKNLVCLIFICSLTFKAVASQKLTPKECQRIEKQANLIETKSGGCEEMDYSFCNPRDSDKYRNLLKQLISCPQSSISKHNQRQVMVLRQIMKDQK